MRFWYSNFGKSPYRGRGGGYPPSHTLPPLGRFAPSHAGTPITPPPQSWKQIDTYEHYNWSDNSKINSLKREHLLKHCQTIIDNKWVQDKHQDITKHMQSLNSKTDTYINFYKFEIFAIKAAEKKENNKKICHIFHHNFKNIPCYIMSELSLKNVLFCSIWWWTYIKNFEMGVYRFFYFLTLHIY